VSAPGGDEPDMTSLTWDDLDDAYQRIALEAAQGIAAENIWAGAIVIDERTGDAGKVLSVLKDGDAWVRFPGPGGVDRIVGSDDLKLAADQSWEPDGGWDA
jgi:hypothetical protein